MGIFSHFRTIKHLMDWEGSKYTFLRDRYAIATDYLHAIDEYLDIFPEDPHMKYLREDLDKSRKLMNKSLETLRILAVEEQAKKSGKEMNESDSNEDLK